MQTHTNFLIRSSDALCIFIAGLILFTFGLHHQEIIGFESRFYLFALEMWRHGFSLFPTTYQTPYPDYPVTSTALIYSTAKLFGTLNKWVAVFPSAIAAAATLSGTYLLGASQNRREGWYSVGFLLLTLAFLTEARTISLDMYVVACTTWIFYFAYSAQSKMRSPSWPVIYLLLILSFAIRGPIGIIIPTGVLCVFYLLEKNWKRLIFFGFSGALLLMLCTGILLSMAYYTGGHPFMQDVLRMQILGRMQVNRTPPHYFYFIESMGAYAITYPLAIFFILKTLPQLFKKNAPPHIQWLRLLMGWVLVIMIGLSIPADKKIRYILPIAPALALICSHFLTVVKNRYLGIAVFVFFIVNVFIVEKINLHTNQTREFVQHIEILREQQKARLVFYREGKDGWAIKYLINTPREENPLFVSDINQLPVGPFFLITSEENKNALSAVRTIASGSIGRDKVVVFFINKNATPPSGGS